MCKGKKIHSLVYGDSQWTYRQDLKTEADLWNNFRYILEQNNKERLNGEPLTDTEFDQVKNQLQFSSFYKAGEWLVGENGKVIVHVQRDIEKLHLVVMNHEHIAGGSSVYEVINQYQALDTDGNSAMPARDRRFDVTLMINGLPMIHIELKNKQHPYMDGFRQIKKYIGEGKFTGIFSAVQMFVVSNGVDTKYFAAASDRELNDKFISGWVDNDNNPVTDYLDFAKSVLRIPQAHEMIARYTVLDEDAKRLIILRPYQIHAIEAIRDASKNGKSGFVWHTTGSGKTLTSYKATRNLLMDIPSLDKTIFLIDRKDLDTQTTQAFQAYANNDLIDVDETDNVFDLKNKLKSDDRQVIVTTIQKLQILIIKRLKEGTSEYDKIVNMWFQAFFYSFILTGVLTVIGISDSWATDDMIKCIFPITFNKFWYFTDFFALFFAIPVLNKFLFSISEEVAKKALIIIFVLFSVLGIFNDSFRTAGGYSAIWLIVLYCIGVLAKRVKLFETRKNTTLIILWGLCIFITWLVHDRSGNMQLISYVSPTILLSGMIMVVLFSRLPIKCKFVSKVSPLAFGIYLFQLNQVVWHFMLKDAFVGVVEKPLYIGIPMAFGCASLIFFSGLFVEFIRTILAKICRINLLSKWIVEKLDFVLKK